MNTFNLKFILITIVSLCFFTAVNGADMKPLAELKSAENSKVVNVLLSSEKVEITITDILGHVLVVDNISNGRKTTRPYNFNKLETGIYYIEISDQLRSTTQKIKVTKNDVKIDAAAVVYFKPFFKQRANHIDINMLTQNINTKLEFLDEASNVLYSDEFNGTVLKKRLNLKDLESGTYSLRIIQDDKVYFYTISK